MFINGLRLPITPTTPHWPFQWVAGYSAATLYTGRTFDPATGLYYYRHRVYHPQLGRFVTRDPVGYEGNDRNVYAYVSATPLNSVDANGLQKVKPTPSAGTKMYELECDYICSGPAKPTFKWTTQENLSDLTVPDPCIAPIEVDIYHTKCTISPVKCHLKDGGGDWRCAMWAPKTIEEPDYSITYSSYFGYPDCPKSLSFELEKKWDIAIPWMDKYQVPTPEELGKVLEDKVDDVKDTVKDTWDKIKDLPVPWFN